MAMKTIKVLRKFYHNGALLEVGKIVTVSEVEAKGYVGSNKAEIIPEAPPIEKAAIIPEAAPEEVIQKEDPKKEQPKSNASKAK